MLLKNGFFYLNEPLLILSEGKVDWDDQQQVLTLYGNNYKVGQHVVFGGGGNCQRDPRHIKQLAKQCKTDHISFVY